MSWGEVKKDDKPIQSKEERIKELQERLKAKRQVGANKLTTGIFGIEGVGKSGLAIAYAAKKIKDVENGYAKIIDLDSGCAELLQFYPEEIKKKIFISNPLIFIENTELNTYEIDNIATFNNVKRDIYSIKELMDLGDTDCKLIIIDGLSQLLKLAENQMRMDKNINPDGGVNMIYWKNRNKIFEEILEFSKALPIDVIFIGHSDFLRTEEGKELASIKQKVLAMCHQIIEPIKLKEDKTDKVTFIAKINKSKYNILEENKKYVFAEKEGEKYWFDVKDMFEKLKYKK